ncbi:hypothetical protein M422DRAFT_24702 [Sphaerobolus stellatus SS14]|nr:hypothetical protein M422DRAFT_24702 [Sphaerobolus stellatus SS14]
MAYEGESLTTFEKAPEFFDALEQFLTASLRDDPTVEENQKELGLMDKLIMILEEYHEQSYLLDPFLERMVIPVVEALKEHVAEFATAGDEARCSSARILRISTLIYTFIKCRGRKTIVNFFPHQVPDLPIALDYLSNPKSPCQSHPQWSLRYTVLLWLSLICMIPFDLARFDDTDVPTGSETSRTAQRIQQIATENLSRAGVEREGAAILLSRLYVREDTCSLLGGFIQDSSERLGKNPDFFRTIGILQALCEITKSGVPDLVMPYVPSMREILAKVEASEFLLNNSLVRKYKIKLEGRLSAGSLPAGTSKLMRKARKALKVDNNYSEQDPDSMTIDEDIEIPDELENTITVLLTGIQDRDTSVRYSSAKYLARVSERLPSFLTEQVLDNVTELFSIHLPASQRMEDLPTVAESTWQGACLACAEMARRGLITGNRLEELLEWLKKALLFDVRQGSHSIGSSVRDAAAYVLWALARAQTFAAMEPFAIPLAQRLVSVSLFDRDIQIRRAASAAFQEIVGRLSLFPHGIDVILKADFFAVGVRKNSFLVAAPQVAQHPEYRQALLDHLLNRSLVHWDVSMRILGSQSLRAICELDLANLAPNIEEKLLKLVNSFDSNEVHGALLSLAELAALYRGDKESERLNLFTQVTKMFPGLLQKRSNELAVSAACLFISNALSLSAIEVDPSPTSPWRKVIDVGLRYRTTDVQEAATMAWQAMSELVDCTEEVMRYVKEFPKASPIFQQSFAHAFGMLAYDKYDHAVTEVLDCLLSAVDSASPNYSSNVEARRNCFLSLPDIPRTLRSKALLLKQDGSPITVQILHAFLKGLQDYTFDERGDVGSWIRMASIRGLALTIIFLFDIAESKETTTFNLAEWLPLDTYHEAIGGILKQGVERLDNVRKHAGEHFVDLLKRGGPKVENGSQWTMDGEELVKGVFNGEDIGWNDGQWLFPRAVQFLEIRTYRKSILNGLVLSVGSKTDGTQRPVSKHLTSYAESLPVESSAGKLTLIDLTKDLLDFAKKAPTQNQTVIPVLQTLDILLDGGVLDKLGDDEAGRNVLQEILNISTRNVARLKNVQRIGCSMKIVNGLLPIRSISSQAVSAIPNFLLHAFPRIRSETAEHLYIVTQAKDLGFETEEVENILLETDWSVSVADLQDRVTQLVTLMRPES